MAAQAENRQRDAARHDAKPGFGDDVRCSTPVANSEALFIEAASSTLVGDRDAAACWLADHREAFETALLRHGAVVLRGFAIDDTDAFAALAAPFEPHVGGYAGGTSPRSVVKGQVMESTRTDPAFHIKLHQEMSYLPHNPRLIAFYCRIPADQGGETIIGDMRRVTAALGEPLLQALAEKGVRYTRNLRMPDLQDERTDPRFNHIAWTAYLDASTPAEAEAACRARGIDFAWRDDGSLDIWTDLPGVARHPVTGEQVYFNQLHLKLIRPLALGDALCRRVAEVYGDTLPRPFDACFGDGSPLADADHRAIMAAHDAAVAAFPWQAGDVMFVENKLTAHGRNPYSGTRDVQVVLLD